MLFLAQEDPEKDIQLYINSPGGSITAGMAIYDTMQYVKNDVMTICIGSGRLDGGITFVGRGAEETFGAAQFADFDPPAFDGRPFRAGDRHRYSCPGDPPDAGNHQPVTFET